MKGKFHGNTENDTELKKLKKEKVKLEQMVGKLTMERNLWLNSGRADQALMFAPFK